jgi:hypothetical protein
MHGRTSSEPRAHVCTIDLLLDRGRGARFGLTESLTGHAAIVDSTIWFREVVRESSKSKAIGAGISLLKTLAPTPPSG